MAQNWGSVSLVMAAACNLQPAKLANWQLATTGCTAKRGKLFGWLANGWQTRATTTKFGAIKCCQMQNACMGLIIIHKQHFAMAEELFRLPLILFFFAPREFVCVARYIAQ